MNRMIRKTGRARTTSALCCHVFRKNSFKRSSPSDNILPENLKAIHIPDVDSCFRNKLRSILRTSINIALNSAYYTSLFQGVQLFFTIRKEQHFFCTNERALDKLFQFAPALSGPVQPPGFECVHSFPESVEPAKKAADPKTEILNYSIRMKDAGNRKTAPAVLEPPRLPN